MKGKGRVVDRMARGRFRNLRYGRFGNLRYDFVTGSALNELKRSF